MIMGATDPRVPAGFAPIPIGLVLTLIHLISIPVTNTSVSGFDVCFARLHPTSATAAAAASSVATLNTFTLTGISLSVPIGTGTSKGRRMDH